MNTIKNPDLENIYVSETDLAEAREILGEGAKIMTDDQLRNQVAGMQFLIESWMDEYERSIFDGKTLDEKLSE